MASAFEQLEEEEEEIDAKGLIRPNGQDVPPKAPKEEAANADESY